MRKTIQNQKIDQEDIVSAFFVFSLHILPKKHHNISFLSGKQDKEFLDEKQERERERKREFVFTRRMNNILIMHAHIYIHRALIANEHAHVCMYTYKLAKKEQKNYNQIHPGGYIAIKKTNPPIV
ncbi:hypothetical protein ACJX0J_029169, partial [Zea mays]